jgi:hypothetical protein
MKGQMLTMACAIINGVFVPSSAQVSMNRGGSRMAGPTSFRCTNTRKRERD